MLTLLFHVVFIIVDNLPLHTDMYIQYVGSMCVHTDMHIIDYYMGYWTHRYRNIHRNSCVCYVGAILYIYLCKSPEPSQWKISKSSQSLTIWKHELSFTP